MNTLRWSIPVYALVFASAAAVPGFAQTPRDSSIGEERVAVSRDLQMIYDKTDAAKSIADYSVIFDFCRNVMGDKTRTNDDRQYARMLMSWAANRRGEARSDQAGILVRNQQLTEAEEMDAAALRDFELALQLDSTRWRAHHNLAIIRAIQGDNIAALAGFNKAIALNPKFSDAYFNRGEIYFRTNQYDQALLDYNQVIQIKPEDSAVYSARAHTLYAMGKTEDALADYTKAMELSPNSVDAITEYADTCQSLGKWKDAAIAYQQAIQLDGQNTRTLQNAAWMMATCPDEFYRNGKTAVATAQRTVRTASSGPTAQTLDVLAAAQAAAGDFTSAQNTVAEALRTTTDPVLRNELMMRGKLYERKRGYVQPKR